MSDGTSGQGPAPADEFDRELRELTEGTAPAPLFLEPSAAERAKASAADPGKAGKRERHGHRTGSLMLVVLLIATGGLVWLGLHARRAQRLAGGRGSADPGAPGALGGSGRVSGRVADGHDHPGGPVRRAAV